MNTHRTKHPPDYDRRVVDRLDPDYKPPRYTFPLALLLVVLIGMLIGVIGQALNIPKPITVPVAFAAGVLLGLRRIR